MEEFRCRLSQDAIDSGLHPQIDPHGTRLGYATETEKYYKVRWDENVSIYYYAKRYITKVEEGQ